MRNTMRTMKTSHPRRQRHPITPCREPCRGRLPARACGSGQEPRRARCPWPAWYADSPRPASPCHNRQRPFRCRPEPSHSIPPARVEESRTFPRLPNHLPPHGRVPRRASLARVPATYYPRMEPRSPDGQKTITDIQPQPCPEPPPATDPPQPMPTEW